jgi:hypothetical protein
MARLGGLHQTFEVSWLQESARRFPAFDCRNDRRVRPGPAALERQLQCAARLRQLLNDLCQLLPDEISHQTIRWVPQKDKASSLLWSAPMLRHHPERTGSAGELLAVALVLADLTTVRPARSAQTSSSVRRLTVFFASVPTRT